jgi:tetratricopeptide (TPR) repeat protein
VAIVGVSGLVIAGAGAWWLLQGEPSPPRVVGLEKPLPFDETVELRWTDEETGEEDVWKVTKRETAPEDRLPGPVLPEPDPDAGNHEPNESARTLLAMGLESWKRGDILEAMAQLRDAIEVDPDDPLPRTQYGRLKVLAMEYSEALPHLERAAALQPSDPQVWLDLATLYEKALLLDQGWGARRRAEELVGDGSIYQDELSGFWLIEGTSIHP